MASKKPVAKKKAAKPKRKPKVKKTSTENKLPPRVEKSPSRVVVLQTMIQGKELVIRSNPTTEQVERFVVDQHRRFAAGLPSGDDGITGEIVPSFGIIKAVEYENDTVQLDPKTEGRPIRIKGTIPKSQWPDWAKKD